MTEIRANAVSVDKLFRARCQLPGCGWTGTDHATYQDANAERQGHLTWHRMTTTGRRCEQCGSQEQITIGGCTVCAQCGAVAR